jgi:phosphohistidine swiveling domain-containing protein
MGTGTSTSILTDGQLVTVNGTTGRVTAAEGPVLRRPPARRG